MDLSRAAYSRDLKITAMRALDAGSTGGEIARKYQLSPKLLERWRGEWRAKGESAFPGSGRRGADLRSRRHRFYDRAGQLISHRDERRNGFVSHLGFRLMLAELCRFEERREAADRS